MVSHGLSTSGYMMLGLYTVCIAVLVLCVFILSDFRNKSAKSKIGLVATFVLIFGGLQVPSWIIVKSSMTDYSVAGNVTKVSDAAWGDDGLFWIVSIDTIDHPVKVQGAESQYLLGKHVEFKCRKDSTSRAKDSYACTAHNVN